MEWPGTEPGPLQWEAGDLYSVVADLMVLRCTSLEKLRKSAKRLVLNQMRNR
jgi:hypothetical protein